MLSMFSQATLYNYQQFSDTVSVSCCVETGVGHTSPKNLPPKRNLGFEKNIVYKRLQQAVWRFSQGLDHGGHHKKNRHWPVWWAARHGDWAHDCVPARQGTEVAGHTSWQICGHHDMSGLVGSLWPVRPYTCGQEIYWTWGQTILDSIVSKLSHW